MLCHWKLEIGAYLATIHCDDTKDYNAFKAWAEPKGIYFEPTTPRNPEANGPAERFGGYVMQTARTMLIDSGLPPYLWPFAVDSAVHILNRLVRTDMTTKPPAQLWHEDLDLLDKEVSLKHLRRWGAYVHILIEDRTKAQKMDPRAQKGHLIGYEGTHIYKVWIPASRQII